MHRMHRIFSGNGWLVILGIRKPAPDHRRSQLPAQQPLVLFILFILCIHVHKKISIPRRRCRLIQVGEMSQAVPGLVRAGRPRSRGDPFWRIGDARTGSSPESAPRAATARLVYPVYPVHPCSKKISIPRRRYRLIQVGEMSQAVPGLVRAGRPRSRGDPFWRIGDAACRLRNSICLPVYSCPFVSIRGSSSFLDSSFDFFSTQVI